MQRLCLCAPPKRFIISVSVSVPALFEYPGQCIRSLFWAPEWSSVVSPPAQGCEPSCTICLDANGSFLQLSSTLSQPERMRGQNNKTGNRWGCERIGGYWGKPRRNGWATDLLFFLQKNPRNLKFHGFLWWTWRDASPRPYGCEKSFEHFLHHF